jgi:hypothetical protein
METVAGNTGLTGNTSNPVGGDLVGDAIAELYAGDPDLFVERRRELASQARAAGNREAAKTIAGLGKPTRSAWIVNNLIRADPGVAASLAELGGKLRSGDALDGANIRELSRERRELIDSLVRRAMAEASQDSPSVALRDEVTDTFNAALADPDVAEQVTAGALLKAVHWAGFGPGIGSAVSSGPARAASAPRTSEAADVGAGTAGKTTPARRPGARTGAAGGPTGATGTRARARTGRADTAERAGARAAPEQESPEQQEAARLAAEAAAEREREERREIIARAEEAAAEASQAADAAATTEREISDSIAFMQERLNREQQRLVQARRDTRQAAAAATRAKQTLERIRRQFS